MSFIYRLRVCFTLELGKFKNILLRIKFLNFVFTGLSGTHFKGKACDVSQKSRELNEIIEAQNDFFFPSNPVQQTESKVVIKLTKPNGGWWRIVWRSHHWLVADRPGKVDRYYVIVDLYQFVSIGCPSGVLWKAWRVSVWQLGFWGSIVACMYTASFEWKFWALTCFFYFFLCSWLYIMHFDFYSNSLLCSFILMYSFFEILCARFVVVVIDVICVLVLFIFIRFR